MGSVKLTSNHYIFLTKAIVMFSFSKAIEMLRLLLISINFDGILSWHEGTHIHPSNLCNRECEYGYSMDCYFDLVIDNHSTLSEECRDCPTDLKECFNFKCIIADGNKTSLMTANYDYPGPSIEVCSNDTIIVDVFNRLLEPTTMHWHGISQKKTPQMDGVPYLTQYPIQPGQIKRYKFTADNPGSYWYHSHFGAQKAFGVQGSLIIRQPKSQEPFARLYDVDTKNQVIFISDWAYNKTMYPISNILVNGKGYNKQLDYFTKFEVEKGLRYRFRLIFAGSSDCIVQISIDNHIMLMISTDGNDLQPIQVESILLTSGERYDFILKADQKVENYLLRVQGKDRDCKGIYQVAVIHYRDAEERIPFAPALETFDLKGPQLNTDYERDNKQDMPIHRCQSLNPYPAFMKSAFQTYYFHINMMNNSYIMNGISFKLNKSVSLLDVYDILDDSDFTCDNESLNRQGEDCQARLCECAHMTRLSLNEFIEVVIVNDMEGTHPIHLHGYSFYVVGQGDFNSEDSKFNAEQIDKIKPFPRNTDHPPMKDTVLVHGNGYTIIRFYTDNPGYWFFHCHIWHMDFGMAVIFKVGG